MFTDVTFDFSGRALIVTGIGSPSGIGRAILRGFAEAGAHVAGCDIDEDQLADVRREQPDAFVKTVDVRDKMQVDDFVRGAAARYGRIDILVNNAGIAPFCPIIDLDEATWDKTFDTNVKGYFLFAQAVARQMIGPRAGRQYRQCDIRERARIWRAQGALLRQQSRGRQPHQGAGCGIGAL